MASHGGRHIWGPMNTPVPVHARFSHYENRGLFGWKLKEEQDKIFRAFSTNCLSLSSILKIYSFGNGRCSSS